MAQLRSTALGAYRRTYKGGGCNDWHHALFAGVRRLALGASDSSTSAAVGTAETEHDKRLNVLYPGCHRHLTASLCFESVTYVDCDKKVGNVFADPAARAYVDAEKLFAGAAEYKFCAANFERLGSDFEDASFDLLLSLSAGLVSPACSRYVRPGGFLLASDAHADARTAFLLPEWTLVAVWDSGLRSWDATDTTLAKCFQVIAKGNGGSRKRTSAGGSAARTATTLITREQVDESVRVGSKSARSFRLSFEPLVFLFQKQSDMKRVPSPDSAKSDEIASNVHGGKRRKTAKNTA